MQHVPASDPAVDAAFAISTCGDVHEKSAHESYKIKMRHPTKKSVTPLQYENGARVHQAHIQTSQTGTMISYTPSHP